MTANQIEYWKLLETKRHNVATETMDKPVKESQAAYNYASIGLIHEQAATQETVRAMNLASAAASYASAANQYAQEALNYERIQTEGAQQNYLNEQARNMSLRSEYQSYVNEWAPYDIKAQNTVYMFNAKQAEDMSAAWERSADQLASWSVFGKATGLNAGDVISTGTKVFQTIYGN